MWLRISISALVVQLESMSDIASSDLFNIVQVLQSWCFKRNSNRIYSGRKDWPEDSPTTRFVFLLVILMEIAILYAWCFFLCCHRCVLLKNRNSHHTFNGRSPVAWQSQLGTVVEGCLQVELVAAEVRGWRCELECNLLKGPDTEPRSNILVCNTLMALGWGLCPSWGKVHVFGRGNVGFFHVLSWHSMIISYMFV